ncbi:MAG: hypothetical protein A2W28_05995 [Gammaproteobacteria bacterium RBG_16_51_14]|nr:MAG: hypothetical protein A2W28_05995 [Gammaproteobacteria bacterium RBG_16_51_14]
MKPIFLLVAYIIVFSLVYDLGKWLLSKLRRQIVLFSAARIDKWFFCEVFFWLSTEDELRRLLAGLDFIQIRRNFQKAKQ